MTGPATATPATGPATATPATGPAPPEKPRSLLIQDAGLVTRISVDSPRGKALEGIRNTLMAQYATHFKKAGHEIEPNRFPWDITVENTDRGSFLRFMDEKTLFSNDSQDPEEKILKKAIDFATGASNEEPIFTVPPTGGAGAAAPAAGAGTAVPAAGAAAGAGAAAPAAGAAAGAGGAGVAAAPPDPQLMLLQQQLQQMQQQQNALMQGFLAGHAANPPIIVPAAAAPGIAPAALPPAAPLMAAQQDQLRGFLARYLLGQIDRLARIEPQIRDPINLANLRFQLVTLRQAALPGAPQLTFNALQEIQRQLQQVLDQYLRQQLQGLTLEVQQHLQNTIPAGRQQHLFNSLLPAGVALVLPSTLEELLEIHTTIETLLNRYLQNQIELIEQSFQPLNLQLPGTQQILRTELQQGGLQAPTLTRLLQINQAMVEGFIATLNGLINQSIGQTQQLHPPFQMPPIAPVTPMQVLLNTPQQIVQNYTAYLLQQIALISPPAAAPGAGAGAAGAGAGVAGAGAAGAGAGVAGAGAGAAAPVIPAAATFDQLSAIPQQIITNYTQYLQILIDPLPQEVQEEIPLPQDLPTLLLIPQRIDDNLNQYLQKQIRVIMNMPPLSPQKEIALQRLLLTIPVAPNASRAQLQGLIAELTGAPPPDYTRLRQIQVVIDPLLWGQLQERLVQQQTRNRLVATAAFAALTGISYYYGLRFQNQLQEAFRLWRPPLSLPFPLG